MPGVERSKRSPFGEFISTWDLPKKIPGPYHVHPMGRTENNFKSLCAERDRTIEEMEKARVYQVNKMIKSLSSIDLFICLLERRIINSTELIINGNIFRSIVSVICVFQFGINKTRREKVFFFFRLIK